MQRSEPQWDCHSVQARALSSLDSASIKPAQSCEIQPWPPSKSEEAQMKKSGSANSAKQTLHLADIWLWIEVKAMAPPLRQAYNFGSDWLLSQPLMPKPQEPLT